MPERMPDDRARSARIALAVLAGALGTVLFGAGLWMVFRPAPPGGPVQTEIEPAEETTPLPGAGGATLATSSAGDAGEEGGAGIPGAPSTPVSGSAGAKTQTPKGGRAAKVAFRLGASIYVVNEDGSDATVVVRSDVGPYSLSPDGRTLAVIDGGVLLLVDVATRDETDAGPAEAGAAPVWAADSTSVIVRRNSASGGDLELWRVAREDGEAELLGPGEQAAVSPDGKLLVVLEPQAEGEGVRVGVSADGGALRSVAAGGGMPTAVGAAGGRVLVALGDEQRGSGIISMKPDGSDLRQIVGIVPGEAAAIWSEIAPSPDGTTLAVQATGDDGYARAYVVPLAGGTRVDLTQRRDASLHGWSADGKRLFLIEGNALQGQATSLVSVAQNGTKRLPVVTGAE